jgi:hypothetical protein
MKHLFAIFFLLPFHSAFASYFATHCTNAYQSISYESGQIKNELSFKYYDGEEKTAKVSLFQLDMIFSDKVILKEEKIHQCGFFQLTTVYAGKVTFTPKSDYPDTLDMLGNDKKISTEVICQYVINSRAPCPE